MRIFGKDWTAVDHSVMEELWTLEREGAIYTEHWQEHLSDFRHVRIKFTDDEKEEYVRSLWAYEMFLRAGSPPFAKDVPDIPIDIATRADEYTLVLRDGHTEGPPYHCIAGFIGEHLEGLACTNERDEVVEELGKAALILTVKRSIDSLTPSIRLFKYREKGLANWTITCEDDIRDLLYVMLRASVSDLKREEPVRSRAGTYGIVDLYSEVARLFIEIKWIGQNGRWKQIIRQINDDIQLYIADSRCETLIFVIVDAAKDIPDPHVFENDLSKTQTIGGHSSDVMVFVREP